MAPEPKAACVKTFYNPALSSLNQTHYLKTFGLRFRKVGEQKHLRETHIMFFNLLYLTEELPTVKKIGIVYDMEKITPPRGTNTFILFSLQN